MTAQDSIARYFLKVIKDLRGDQSTKKITTTGQSADSLTFEADDKGGQLLGADYFYWQIVGRKPGKFAPPDAILQWIQDKGIKPNNPKTSLKSLAYLINRKMAQKGTDIFMGKRPGLDFNKVVGGDNLESLLAELGVVKAKELTTFLVNEIKKPA